MKRTFLFARPRSTSETVTLLFVLLAISAWGMTGYAQYQRGSIPEIAVVWPGALLVLAGAARLYPVWHAQWMAMTADRARKVVGSTLFVFVTLSITGHMALESLGFAAAYPFLGALSGRVAAPVTLGVIAAVALVVLLRLPVWRGFGHTGRLLGAATAWMSRMAGRFGGAVNSATQADVVESAVIEPLPMLEYPDVEDEAVEPLFPREDLAPLPPLPRPVAAPRPDPVQNGPLLPPIEVFVPAPKGQAVPLDVDYKARRIEETLASFNVKARVVGNHVGPTVTQFDVQPERGVKVKSITSLQNDLALALAAPTIRIQAPVPGKPVVGVEIPNTAAQMVTIRDLLESEKYRGIESQLKVVLGKDVSGGPAVIDLAKMPHLLIAGATGSGKSVCVNALISCLLYANTPEQVRLMMIDPKRVELSVYNGVPHLLSPVVADMDKVVGVLQWALREMERRYHLFSDSTVRNIQRYNEKMAANGGQGLPYIVLIIDELADLMMVSPDEVEDAICRLAQLARAAGIHLVIATQRPSVDVVTGLIKANFPARIAFQMSSQIDSRTILDSVGAEKLLGRGDMLYQAPDAPKPVRLQGAFLSDGEIERLVEFWQRSPLLAAVQKINDAEFAAAERAASEEGDELLDEATRMVRQFQTASASFLQRRLRIGYARARRLLDQLEERGVVRPTEGGKQWEVMDESEGEAEDGEPPW